jgi:lipoprotein-releasing system ATP-binding protein
MSTLQVDNLCKEFPTSANPLVVLRNVTLRLSAGENLAIVGPSGSGKSTLLHILGTLDFPTRGTVKIHEQNPFALTETALAEFRNRHVGFIFQEHYLLPQLSVLENVLVPACTQSSVSPMVVQRARELLQRVGLQEREGHRPAQLSGGERQRVAVARALIHSPQLILADEPTGSLDRNNAVNIAKLLLELQSQSQAMLLIVTHSLEIAQLFSQRYEMQDGTLVPLGASAAESLL